MKKIILLLTILMMSIHVWAQSGNVILFTENGERFTAILNGIRQNEKPETNVKITGLNAEFYKLKVIFDNNTLGEKNFNMGIQLGSETTYTIKKNTKGEYVIRLVSAVTLAEAPATPAGQTTIIYNENPAANPTTTYTQQTTQTTTTSGNPDNVNVNIGINAGEQGGGINMNVSEMDGATTTHSSTTTTTTTVTNSTLPPAQVYSHHDNTPPPSYLPGYNGPIGCPMPMSTGDFLSLKQTISSKNFEETKLTIAKQVIAQQCLLVTQVKEIMDLFSFEESKLDIAKYAYNHTYDVGNYFKVNDAFTFESSTDELNKFIQSKH